MGLGPVNIPGGRSAADIIYDNTLSGLSAETVQGAIDEMILGSPIIDYVPSQAAALHYNGASQTPTWINYDESKLAISGNTSGTSVGEYTVTFTPKTGYKWFDGTTSGKTAKWSIIVAKLTVPQQNGSLDYNGSSRSPAWNSDYVSSKMTLGGTTSAINAGNYEATFDLNDKANYQWEDGTTTIKTVVWRINKISPTVTAPTAKTNLKYTGNAQALVNAGSTTGGTLQYSLDGVSYGTSIPTGINVGSYTVYYRVTGNTNYNDVAPQSVSVSIGKATGSLTLDKNSLSLGIASLTGTITATGTGAITAESSDSTVAEVTSVSGGVITVTAKKTGTATITVHCAASASYTAPSDETCSVVADIPSGNLAENTPAMIQAVAQAGTGANYWSVGDRIQIDFESVTVGSLNLTGLSACAFIIGFNHNQAVEGTGIHFQFGKTTSGKNIALVDASYGNNLCEGDVFKMKYSSGSNHDSNYGGWKSSYMRSTICSAMLNALPSAWRNVIANVTKYTDNTAGSGGTSSAANVNSTTDKFFLLAEYEVFGVKDDANPAEQNFQKQYAYYANGNSKVKYKHSAQSDRCGWWLRSPSGTSFFCCVRYDGIAITQHSSDDYGFAPAFMVG